MALDRPDDDFDDFDRPGRPGRQVPGGDVPARRPTDAIEQLNVQA
jgi:hypothetical protein